MEGMYEQAAKNIFTLDHCAHRYRSISVKCPFCREYSIINLDEDKDFVTIDQEYLGLLLDAYEGEFKAIECSGGTHKAHEDEFTKCFQQYNAH